MSYFRWKTLSGVFIASMFAWTTAAAAVGSKTHLNRNASDHVMLEVIGSPDATCIAAGLASDSFTRRNLPDGTSSTFSGPSDGEVLVITDVDWQLDFAAPDSRSTLRLYIVNKANPVFAAARVLESSIQVNAAGAGGTTTSAGAGVIVSPGGTLCFDHIGGGGGSIEHILLRGYLAQG